MIYKLHTSTETQKIFKNLSVSSGLQPFALSKIAISFSLRKGPLEENDLNTNGDGLELNRQTIFGDTELLYRCLICMNENREVPENEFFPPLVKAHLDRGAKLLAEESRYNRNFYVNLCKLDSNL